MGKDHTLFALAPGFVRFYNAPRIGKSEDNHRNMRKYCEFVALVLPCSQSVDRRDRAIAR